MAFPVKEPAVGEIQQTIMLCGYFFYASLLGYIGTEEKIVAQTVANVTGNHYFCFQFVKQ